ncbi:MAG: CDP-diacylglycerol--serine O-phosphatidyltransferase [Hyphomicrobiales bacterium]|nr:MAG: CDP-diacylglycerol--serine O-phosphatidyltransferase [Hyphomicrobiales bacterium]
MEPLFPPFEPGERKSGTSRRQRRFNRLPLRIILPNLVTLLALCSGLTAIRLALETRFELAIVAILVAGVLDGVDGRLARMLKGTSEFGAELDSLADFVNFGVAPAIILYTWGLQEAGSLGWIAVLVFAISTGLRLARFNVMRDDPGKPSWHADFFVGMPAPAGALTVLLPVYLYFLDLLPQSVAIIPPVIGYILFVAFMMVSRLPTFSGKRIGARIQREHVLPILVAIVVVVGVVISYPFASLALVVFGYLATLPFAWRSWHKKAAAMADGTLVDDIDDGADDTDDDDEAAKS